MLRTHTAVGGLFMVLLLSLLQSPRSRGETATALPPPAAGIKIEFDRDIAPILTRKCQSCHGAGLQSGGLALDTRESALKGGYSGAVIKPGKSAESKLIHLVAGLDKQLVMPISGPRLTPEEIGLLRAWIDQGVPWPAGTTQAARLAESESKTRSTHWAFLPPERPPIPEVRDRDWIKNSIDAFILAKLEGEGIAPSPQTDRETLIRRVSLDLTGLPPTVEEVRRFLADNRSGAYERLVDGLLESDHYGEKWARHWLDLARYGDSDGFETDAPRPHAWRYRQWVIEALNRNMPFDQFTIEQIAGDLLPNATVEQRVATGFNRNTLTNREGGMDLEALRIEQILDRTNTLGAVWLGLTVGCAVCHDHKFDPITQKDYYQLFAFFNSAMEKNIEAPLPGEMGPYLAGKSTYDKKRRELLLEYEVCELMAEWEKKTLEAATNPDLGGHWTLAWETVGYDFDGGQDILRLDPSQRSQRQQDQLTDHFIKWYGIVIGGERYKQLKFDELREKLEQLAEQYPALTEAQTLTENLSPPSTHVLIRGDSRQPGIEVEPATPAVLPPLPPGPEPPRVKLARWLVSRDNPLTARVTVNRMWQEFFGRGLVESSENLGTRGDAPSHPKLLDFLATEFMDSGWNVKTMHRMIVESATYRQSSNARENLQLRDASNKLLARQSRLRLQAELIRDAALAASGLLNPRIGGKSFFPPQPDSVGELAYRNQWKETTGPDRYRRGLYIFLKRTMPYPQLAAFDAPDSLSSCSRRERSTTPLQALNLLNDPVFFEAAEGLAVRVLREEPGSLDERIDYAFRLCLARNPTATETNRMIQYYRERMASLDRRPETIAAVFPLTGVTGIDRTEAAAWVGISSVLLNLDEFITRE